MQFEDFVPDYIKEELEEYIKQTELGKSKIMKWNNIKSLLGLAKINNRLTSKQIEYIIKKYNRENTK